MTTMQGLRIMEQDAPSPMTAAEYWDMKEIIDQIWASQREMTGDMARLKQQAEVTADRLRALDSKFDISTADLKAQIKSVVTDAAELRKADAPALATAKWLRTITFGVATMGAGGAIVWTVNRWLDWASKIGGPHP